MVTQHLPSDNGAQPRQQGAESGLHTDDMWDYVGSDDAVVAAMEQRGRQNEASFLLYQDQLRRQNEDGHLTRLLSSGTSAATRMGLSDREFVHQAGTAARQARELVNESRTVLPTGVQMAGGAPAAVLSEDPRVLEKELQQLISSAIGVPDRLAGSSEGGGGGRSVKGSFEAASAMLAATVSKWQTQLEPMLQQVYDLIWRRFDEVRSARALCWAKRN